MNAQFSVQQAFRVAAGTPTDPTTPDTEISVDGGATYADCVNEITTGGGNGSGYLTLTGAEMNNPIIAMAFKSANCLESQAFLYPRALAIVGSGTLSAGSAGGGTLGILLAYDVTGCFVRTTGGTGGGGVGGASNQARKIITYNTTTGAFTVSPNWTTTPDNTTTYDVLLPEGVTLGMLRSIPQTGDSYTRLGTPAGASIAADIAAIPTTKTGYSLAATGLDAISAEVPDGVGTTWPQRVLQGSFGRWFYRHVWDKMNGLIKTYRADGTTVNTVQTATTSNSTGDDVGNASAP
jgi:hypothetical protein